MMMRLLIGWLLLASPAFAAVDLSEYRTATYGSPTHYCDPAKSLASSGTGTSGNPWNMTQCMTQPVAGNVVGIMAGVSVDLPAPDDDNVAAFSPSNSGTNTTPRSGRIVYVTQWPAISLANVETNSLRTEFRHAGTDEDGHTQNSGTGGPMLGAYNVNYITYDGFYIDMSHAYIREDSGLLRPDTATGVEFKNFVVKGTGTHVWSNPVIYRPQDATDTVVSNFRVYDFTNTSDFTQAALFSDQYGDRNFLIEHGEIDNTQRGIFLKGSGSPSLGDRLNYGTIQYMIVHDVRSCYQFNALSTSQLTTLKYSLCYNVALDDAGDAGVVMSSETTPARFLTIDHVTVAKVDAAGINTYGALITRSNGIAAASNSVTITNNLFETDSGSFGFVASLDTANLPDSMNYNGYYANGGTQRYFFSSTQYNSLDSWQDAISGRDANSVELSSSPFTNRSGNVFTITGGHTAKTASSTGGELGAYATSETIGPDTTDSGGGGGGGSSGSGASRTSGAVRFFGTVRMY